MKTRSITFNFIMNFILTASSIVFPLITFPYISRVLGAAGNGKVAFATSVLTYFAMFASLGIPTYGIRACAKIRDDKEKLSKTVQELMLINIGTLVVTYGIFILTLFLVPKFGMQKELLLINSISLVLNVFGVNWLYNAIEQYAYITVCSIVFKLISLIMMFAWVKDRSDYIVYTGICVFAASGSYIFSFLRLRKFIDFKKQGTYEFKRHLKPIMVFFAMAAATSVYTNLDIVMLGFMKEDVDVGYYNAAIKVKTILVLVITSLGTVLLPRLSYYVERRQKEVFYQTIVKAFRFVMICGLPMTIYFMLLADETVRLLSGKGFEGAVLPMILLMPTVLVIGLSNISGIQVLTPTNQEKKVLTSIVCGAVIDFALNLILIPKYGAAGAAFATLVAEGVVLITQLVYLRNLLKELWKQLNVMKVLGAGVISTVVLVLVNGWLDTLPIITLCVTGIVFLGLYFGLLLGMKEAFVVDMLQMVLGKKRRVGKGD